MIIIFLQRLFVYISRRHMKLFFFGLGAAFLMAAESSASSTLKNQINSHEMHAHLAHSVSDSETITEWITAASAAISVALTSVLALSTWALWKETRRLAKGAEIQTENIRKSISYADSSAQSAIEQLKISRDSMIADLRPWLSIEITPASNLEISEDGIWHIRYEMTLRNVGRSPALGIRYKNILVSKQDDVETQLNTIERLFKNSRNNKNIKRNGNIIFPGGELKIIDVISSPKLDMPKISLPVSNSFPWPDDFVSPRFLVSFVDYLFLGNESGTTTFSYMIAKNLPTGHIIIGVGYGIEATERIVAKEELIFFPWISGIAAT